MASRPLVQVYGPHTKVCGAVPTPQVFLAPIRHDLVRYVQSNLRKNRRQPFAVSAKAGMQSSAMSWGTGRAVARIPRVPGGGTHRAGQGAFGNMCRGGRIFSPVRIWRRWHRKVNLNQKRYAVASAIAASAIPALVMARGHNIAKVPEIPLVIDNKIIDPINRTKQAVKLLLALHAFADVHRCKVTERKRGGRSQWRNRPKTRRVGPLIIQGNSKCQNQRAFRNLPGVEVVHVSDLNLLRLAPGGHLGRFIIWTESAFRQLDLIWGTHKKQSQLKKNYWLPRPILTNPDLARIFNSDQVAQAVRPKQKKCEKTGRKPNYLKNKVALAKLNPYYLVARRLNFRKAYWNKMAKKHRQMLFRNRVVALRSNKTKEGKAKLFAWKVARAKMAADKNRIKRNQYRQYTRVIAGLPKRTEVQRNSLKEKAQKKREAAVERKKAPKKPTAVKKFFHVKKADKGKGKKAEAKGRHKQRVASVEIKAAKAAEKKAEKQ